MPGLSDGCGHVFGDGNTEIRNSYGLPSATKDTENVREMEFTDA
jgi:hypothetical protein